MLKPLIILIVICLTVSVYYCKDNHDPLQPNTLNPEPRYLSFVDNPCQGHPGSLDKAMSDDARLVQYFRKGDTLTLQLHFIANCCPAFVDSAAVSKGNIVISLADSLGNCDCMCDYTDDFNFLYPYDDDVHLVFQWWYLRAGQFSTALDTTIVII
ncbi:MAG TPA: hypothetical protein PLP19_19410 [bacterium]|nr:hypothetical protein [bacterium]HPN45665.1 hypothetical protein [bacterium]